MLAEVNRRQVKSYIDYLFHVFNRTDATQKYRILPIQLYIKAPQSVKTTISAIVTAQRANVTSAELSQLGIFLPLGKSLGFFISAMN